MRSSVRLGWLLVCLNISGCTSLTALFFYPQSVWIATPENAGLAYQDVWLTAADETQVHAWWIPARQDVVPSSNTMVLYLHGNAENISSHAFSVYWLAHQGVNVLALDYRGFGASQGHALLPSVLQDVEAATVWLRQHYPDKTLVVLAQSIGTALAIPFVAQAQDQYRIDGLILDAPFTGYGRVARRVLGQNVLGWLVWPFTVLLPGTWDPIHFADQVSVPTLIMHSPKDQVIAYSFGEEIYQTMSLHNDQVQWLESQGEHVASFAFPEIRKATLNFILSLP